MESGRVQRIHVDRPAYAAAARVGGIQPVEGGMEVAASVRE